MFLVRVTVFGAFKRHQWDLMNLVSHSITGNVIVVVTALHSLFHEPSLLTKSHTQP